MSEHSHKGRKCPICSKPAEARLRPFCSKRCADLDLAHWLKGDYAIAAREAPEGEDEAGESESGKSE
jgi:endogenous inhibitor of DNA gyrase (YacG/DUF329 family)